MALKLMYITNNPKVALTAEKYGIERIWIDLETLGKANRQKNMNTVKSNHRIEDIAIIKPMLSASEMLVRINPINPDSETEITRVIEAGADIIMLPMWKSPAEVNCFLDIVNHRVQTTLLLETKEAVECIDDVLANGGFDEVHIGLNDLHLSYNLSFMFELLANGTVEMLCNKFKKAGVPFGFGGIARLGEGMLPAEKIIMEHYRLGSTRVILSRSFCNTQEIKDIAVIDSVFSENMKKLRDFESIQREMSAEDYLSNKRSIQDCVSKIVANIRERK